MADDGLKEEPIIARLRGKPGEPPAGLTSFVGLLGRSPRPGYWLLYHNLDMSRSVEIAESDIVHAEKLSPEQSPFGGLGGRACSLSEAPRSRIPPRKPNRQVQRHLTNSTSTFDPIG